MTIQYQPYIQKAFKSVVREVLSDVARNGLDGESHFFITFQTNREDVQMPAFLRAKYPEQISIVLQHQFENLEVSDTGFSVDLAFGGVASTLFVPYDALIQFADPAANVGFSFEPIRTKTPAPHSTAEIIDFQSLKRK